MYISVSCVLIEFVSLLPTVIKSSYQFVLLGFVIEIMMEFKHFLAADTRKEKSIIFLLLNIAFPNCSVLFKCVCV